MTEGPKLTKDLLDRFDLAMRGLIGLFGVIVALVVALATPLGAYFDQLQSSLNGGYYSPKLTMLMVMMLTLAPMFAVYLPIAWVTKYLLLRSANPTKR